MDKSDLKEKLLLVGITTGVFLPARVLFSAVVSDHWIGSLGFVSVFGVLFVFLIKHEKLGWLGRIFERQMRKTIGGKTGKYVIAFSLLFLLYFGSSLYFMERGDTIYHDDKQVFLSVLASEKEFNVENIPVEKLDGPNIISESSKLQWFSNIDYGLSIAFAIMNDVTEGWLSHIVVVIFVEQLEVIGLLYFYRKTFRTVSIKKQV